MNNLKKITMALFAFSNGVAFAGTMGPVCVEGAVTVPCPHPSWELGVQALYLQPAYNNTNTMLSYTDSSAITHWQSPSVNWGWGFKLEGSYHFRTGNDVNINWYHYNNTTNGSLLLNGMSDDGVISDALSLDTSFNPRWDAINAEFGQLVRFGEFKKIRFHGGAQYIQISQQFSSITANVPPESVYVRLNGFGPRVGADMSYDWGHGLALYANGATALFVGNNKFDVNTKGVIDPTVSSSYSTLRVIIPEIEGKLGAKYTYALTQGDLSVDVGYMWLDYIHAQSFFTTTGIGGTTDFALNGPYFGLKWLGSL